MPREDAADFTTDVESLTAQIKVSGKQREMLREVVLVLTETLGFSPKKNEMYSTIFGLGLQQYYSQIKLLPHV